MVQTSNFMVDWNFCFHHNFFLDVMMLFGDSDDVEVDGDECSFLDLVCLPIVG